MPILFSKTPLHFAAEKGHLDIVTLLIDKGANINSRDSNNCTPLHIAAKYGRFCVVKYLINKGAGDQEGALHYSALSGHRAIVSFLCKSGININSRTIANRMTPLHLAASKGHLMVVKYLVRSGAGINDLDNRFLCMNLIILPSI